MVDGMLLDQPIGRIPNARWRRSDCRCLWLTAPAQVAAMRAIVKWGEIVCRTYQIAAGINADGDGTAHHSVGDNDALDAYLHQHLFHPYLSA